MGRKKKIHNSRLISLRVDGDLYDHLVRYHNVNINAQVNHYLHNLSMHLDLGGNSVFVYTK